MSSLGGLPALGKGVRACARAPTWRALRCMEQSTGGERRRAYDDAAVPRTNGLFKIQGGRTSFPCSLNLVLCPASLFGFVPRCDSVCKSLLVYPLKIHCISRISDTFSKKSNNQPKGLVLRTGGHLPQREVGVIPIYGCNYRTPERRSHRAEYSLSLAVPGPPSSSYALTRRPSLEATQSIVKLFLSFCGQATSVGILRLRCWVLPSLTRFYTTPSSKGSSCQV